jgi:acetyl-CoA carboxylase biotin carboxyl carrier protein
MAKQAKEPKVDIELLNQVLKIMEKGELVELLLEQDNFKVQLKKSGANIVHSAPAIFAAPAQAMAHTAVPVMHTGAAAAPAKEAVKPAEEDPNVYVVKSPMVGTFYRAPSPDAAPFANVGDNVSPGQTLCIIEAMKIMNEIKSEVKGKVKEIKVENAQAVEFNQAIILIQKA